MLEGKSVIVTGGAKGIGRFIAHSFAEQGANIAIADIDEQRLVQTSSELGEKGVKSLAIPTDVTNESSVQAMTEYVYETFGSIDVLVNDAAVVPHFMWRDKERWPKIEDMDTSFFWDTVLGVALRGTFLVSKHTVPYMREKKKGHIINLHGGGGVTPPGALAYATAKDSLITFTKFHAEEVRDSNICVVIISPGTAIATEDAPEEARNRMPGPDFVGPRFVLCAQVDMGMSGKLLDFENDELVVKA